MEEILINGNLFLLGNNIQFRPEDCFGLKVGEFVSQIGVYKSSSSYEARYNPPAQYAGVYNTDNTDYAAFLLPASGVSGFNLFNPVQPVYMLFVIEKEFNLLYLQDFKRLVTHPHKPIFKVEKV